MSSHRNISTPGRATLSSILLSALGMSIVLPSSTASADLGDFALNGRFTAISDGQWAKTNERFHDEATVISTWTITTSCTTALDCSGHMTSDQGWSADVSYTNPLWYVTRTLDDWMRCPDGGTAPGRQTYKFFEDQFDEPLLRGWDNTLGPSGACGVNKVLNIEMPFKLIPLG
jgi:hypothetical protein